MMTSHNKLSYKVINGLEVYRTEHNIVR